MISSETVLELERQHFIERSLDGTAIRLTDSGARQKHASQETPVPAMNHSRTTAPAKFQRRQRRARPSKRSVV